MKTFRAFFALELKRALVRRNVIIAVLFIITAMYFVQNGASQYKEILNDKKVFEKFEQKKVSSFKYMTQYGGHGFRLYFMPSPTGIFYYNSGAFNQLNANINVGDGLEIYFSLKGKNLFNSNSIDYSDFSGFIFLIGSLLILLYGLDAFGRIGYIKTLISLHGRRRVFFYTLLSRYLIFCAFLLSTLLIGILIIKFNNIPLTGDEFQHLTAFYSIAVLVFLFYFLIGIMASLFKSKTNGVLIILFVWVASIYLIPLGINKMAVKNANGIESNYLLEAKKLSKLMDFEGRAIKKEGKNSITKKSTRQITEMIEGFMDKEFYEIQRMEAQLEKEMDQSIRFIKTISAIAPCSFYMSVCNALSSKGYTNSTRFFQYNRELKDRFERFYVDKKFYGNSEKVESFVKSEENIFYSKSKLPIRFNFGVAATILYILILLTIANRMFNNAIYSISKNEIKKNNNMDVRIFKNKDNIFFKYNRVPVDILFSFIDDGGTNLNKLGFTGNIYIENGNTETKQSQRKFLFICNPKDIPGDIRIKDFLKYFSHSSQKHYKSKELENIFNLPQNELSYRFSELSFPRRAEMLLILPKMINSDLYLFDDTVVGLSAYHASMLKAIMDELRNEGHIVAYVTSNDFVSKAKKKNMRNIIDSKHWSLLVDSLTEEEEND